MRVRPRGAIIASSIAMAVLNGCPDSQNYCEYGTETITSCGGAAGNPSLSSNCIAVSSQDDCNSATKDSDKTSGGCTTSIHFFDVTFASGTCPQQPCWPAFGDSPGQLCIKAHCCSSFVACDQSNECQAYNLCLSNCASGDQACVNSCASTYPQGNQLFQSAVQCGKNACQS